MASDGGGEDEEALAEQHPNAHGVRDLTTSFERGASKSRERVSQLKPATRRRRSRSRSYDAVARSARQSKTAKLKRARSSQAQMSQVQRRDVLRLEVASDQMRTVRHVDAHFSEKTPIDISTFMWRRLEYTSSAARHTSVCLELITFNSLFVFLVLRASQEMTQLKTFEEIDFSENAQTPDLLNSRQIYSTENSFPNMSNQPFSIALDVISNLRSVLAMFSL